MRILFLLVIMDVSSFGHELELPEPEPEPTGAVPPCWAEANSADSGDVVPDCDEFGFYVPRQCNAERTLCWCVTRCGDPLFDTKGGLDLTCEQDEPPCLKELASIAGAPVRFGRFKPRCHSSGFYHHTQCRGTVCWCTDRCGNQIWQSKHNFRAHGVCECPNDDYDWMCTRNPCDQETSACPAFPEAVCKPSACGGCVAKFYVADKEVDCALPEPVVLTFRCTDSDGTPRDIGQRWKRDKCIECECTAWGESCVSPMCAGPSMGWEYCSIQAGMEDVCCPDFDCVGCLSGLRHYDVGDTWTDTGNPCSHCTCNDNNLVSCTTERCPGVNRYIPPLCRWAIPPGVCCPPDDSQNGIVCDEPISACPPGSAVMRDCPSHLCLTATCGHMDAQCKISHCGTCHTVFYDSDGAKVTCQDEPVESEPTCSRSSMTCLLSPCDAGAVCGDHPDAVCYVDSCSPCDAVFYGKRNEPLECGAPPELTAMCDETHTVGDRWEADCLTCECHTDAVVACIPHECGVAPPLPIRCRWAKRTPDECCPSKMVCEEPVPDCPFSASVAASCPDDLCDAPCEGHPEATCLISRCGGCSAKFVDQDNQAVQCEGGTRQVEPECPSEVQMKTCIISPCDLTTCDHFRFPDAICHVDYCQPCTAVFHCPCNKLLDCNEEGKIDEIECKDSFGLKHDEGATWMEGCNECVCEPSGLSLCRAKTCDTATCEGGQSVGERWQESCMTCECGTTLTAACIPHECGVAPPLPMRCRWAKRTPDECCPSKMVCEEPVPDCPFSASVAASCPDDLCNAPCEGHPEATCLISRCGGCSAKFVDQDNQAVQCEGGTRQVEPECPADVPVVTCIVSPCDVATCDHFRFPDAICHVDYCQPCTAVFHCPCNKLLDCNEEGKIDEIECKDSFGLKHDEGTTWMEGCNECVCEPSGLSLCRAKTCDTSLATCDGGHRVGERWEDACMTCECSVLLTAVCIPHECGQAPPIPDRCHLAKQTPDECCPSKIVCEEAISLCGEGVAVAPVCPDDLCDTTCQGHPDATCRISRCAGCEAQFFDASGQRVRCEQGLVTSQPVCEENLPPVTCLVLFCELSPCTNRPDAVCHIDACQPCLIVYYDELNRRIDCSAETKVDDIDLVLPRCDSDDYQMSPQGTPSLPRCLKNGDFAPKQCDTAGDCWCANPDGSVVTAQRDVPAGKEVACASEPPCHRELLDNKRKTERGEDVTSDPVCSSAGWYEPAQCSPATGECWCSERDGTVVPGSLNQQGEPPACYEQCLGDVGNIVDGIVCSEQYNGCPSNAFCHIPPNHTKGKCCRLPPRAMP